jgi:hydroxyethylthiazole kinase-like uncharacterized protein yjeF
MRISDASGPILTAAEMQAAEAGAMAHGETVETLMERAGKAVAECVWRFGSGRSVLVICGPGNNGGDGYVAARWLATHGVDVRVAALGEPGTDAARAARRGWEGPVDELEDAGPEPVLVDALFGTGLSRALSDPVSGALARLKERARFTVAVDVPSGVGSDDGADLGAIPADLTLALGALKPAHLLQPAAQLCGIVRVADIGIPAHGQTTVLTRPHFDVPGPDSHKYKRGLVGIMGGQMPGAAALSAQGAMRLAGYVLISGTAGAVLPHAVVRREWEEIAGDGRLGALLAGPGLGRGASARAKLDLALRTPHPLVLDADALMLLAAGELPELCRSRPVILTPHAGEFDALFGKGAGSKIDRARAAAAMSGAVIVFKGADTVIAEPDGRVRVAPLAPGWLASAGTGDVLAGMVAGCLSGGLAPFEAASAAVWLHGEAARLAGPALIADEIPSHIPAALAACL